MLASWGSRTETIKIMSRLAGRSMYGNTHRASIKCSTSSPDTSSHCGCSPYGSWVWASQRAPTPGYKGSHDKAIVTSWRTYTTRISSLH